MIGNFITGGRAMISLITKRRSSMGSDKAEMTMFCKINYDLIPDRVPKIPKNELKNHIPMRLTRPEIVRAL